MAKDQPGGPPENEVRTSKPTVSQAVLNDRMVKIQALSSLNINPKAKGIWLLITAGFTWKETAKILHVSEGTIRDVLAGKEIKEE